MSELSVEELRWAGIAVRHVLKTQSPNDREYLRDGAGQEAEIKILSLRPALDRLPGEDRGRYAVKSLGRHLSEWTEHELRRRREVDPIRVLESEDEPPQDPAGNQDTAADACTACCLSQDIGDERIVAALHALSSVQQEALNLHYFHGMTFPEIALLVKAPVETVKSRHDGAMAKLRKTLGAGKAE